MKALKTSEATKYLIDKGFKNHSDIKIDSDIFGGDIINLREYSDGTSYIYILRKKNETQYQMVNTYSKMNSKDKKQLIQMILNKL